jgi:mannan endo-1,4-beta-mannosidase
MKKLLFSLLMSSLSFNAFSQIDRSANAETKLLYEKLNKLSLSYKTKQKILLGQQNSFTEGRGWRQDNKDIGGDLRSDMEAVSGVHPAVNGIDFNEIGDWNKDLIQYHVKEVYSRGGVTTLSWHMPTLINDGKGNNSYNDTTARVVGRILPGGDHHALFNTKLNKLITFLKELKGLPIIFRPWHEHNFSWFWWGKDHSTKDEYIKLWRYTVDYLRNNNVHNLLYAYSPNHINGDYLDRYPGDEYVDILGVDHYFVDPQFDVNAFGPYPVYNWKNDVIWLCHEASKRNKIPAITEFGQEGLYYEKFWTDYFGWPLEKEGMKQITGADKLPAKGVAYIMVWRNDIKDPKHFFGPFIGNQNNKNFMDLMSKGIYQGLKNH